MDGEPILRKGLHFSYRQQNIIKSASQDSVRIQASSNFSTFRPRRFKILKKSMRRDMQVAVGLLLISPQGTRYVLGS